MTWLAAAVTGWLVGSGLAWAFIAAATRKPSPQPFRALDDLGELCRHA